MNPKILPIALTILVSLLLPPTTAPTLGDISHSRQLTLADRIYYQRSIEEVYWRHRIWQSPDPKPSIDQLISPAQLQQRVENYLRNSQALEDYWQQPITPAQLQAEMDRMAHYTRQPDVLQELFDALGNDPSLIAECLARPALAERLVTNLYAHDERWSKEPLESWRTRSEPEIRLSSPMADYTLPTISAAASACVDNTWTPTMSAPGARESYTVVWTGSEMIIWGGSDQNNGGKYNPSTDTWTPTNTRNAPTGRASHTAVWTGTEMIVWGGEDINRKNLRTGGRYNPGTDSWTATSTTNAPHPREAHTAVWTGHEMIVWGGFYYTTGVNTIQLNTGGRYDPKTNTWTATSVTNVPAARSRHTAVWTRSEMIVWGGEGPGYLNTGGRYNPSTNTWTATSLTSAPSVRSAHTAVWTGSQMIVWGGRYSDSSGSFDLNTGAKYNPATDSWSSTTVTNAPTARDSHTAVWTGKAMIVWGGGAIPTKTFNTGGVYNPNTNSWTPTALTNAPPIRSGHTAIWTGTNMIVWGGQSLDSGYRDDGAKYNPQTNTWKAISTPSDRAGHSAIWTGSEMIVWGGSVNSEDLNTGGRYSPSTDTWTPTNSITAPSSRSGHTAVWDGSEMIIWGGVYFDPSRSNFIYLNTGGRYNPASDSWTVTSTSGAPTPRAGHVAFWTGSEMIIWGGEGASTFNDGRRYNPATNSWRAISTLNAPTVRSGFSGVWTGSEMIVWGGSYYDPSSGYHELNTGASYNPGSNTWTATGLTNAPTGRDSHTAVWTGTEMIIWGGFSQLAYLNTGARYNPATNSWTAITASNAPEGRYDHTAIWTGSEMIIWGGTNDSFTFNTGGRYNPSTDSWRATSTANAPSPRRFHTAIWEGNQMIIWGGAGNTGGRYCAQPPK